jgi:hypothetical protein
MFPRLLALVDVARMAQIRQDATLINAAIELLEAEGRFDAGDGGMDERIRAAAGKGLDGRIALTDGDGSFVYSLESGGKAYAIAYDALSGTYSESAAAVDGKPGDAATRAG